MDGLNESPSQKEGKSPIGGVAALDRSHASMKALPRRKGNSGVRGFPPLNLTCLNESPSQKEGKSNRPGGEKMVVDRLNESPSQKEGKFQFRRIRSLPPRGLNESPSQKEGKWIAGTRPPKEEEEASMKALPRRKGNARITPPQPHRLPCLNESPSQKEGKSLFTLSLRIRIIPASMKALPRRKGNRHSCFCWSQRWEASMKALPRRKGNAQKISPFST